MTDYETTKNDSSSSAEHGENNLVRIRASAPDAFTGLVGHDYIAARGLGKLKSVQTSAPAGLPSYAQEGK